MLYSVDQRAAERLKEAAQYFVKVVQTNHSQHRQGASQQRESKKLARVTEYDPRPPSKAHIINQNLYILFSNTQNEEIFPTITIIITSVKKEIVNTLNDWIS